MPYICPVCSKFFYSQSQNCIQCDTCRGWVHHDNRLKCSGLTDAEYEEHMKDEFKPYECDHCVAVKIAEENKSIFVQLPFPVECEGNIFGKPTEKIKPDVSSLTPDQLKKFIKNCDAIQDQLDTEKDDDEKLVSTSVNSKYYNINKFNKIRFDEKSKFGLMHVNIASLNLHIDDLRSVLSRLKLDFDVIGISEHKIKRGCTPSNNINITGYDEFKFEPTDTTHGGAGFYIKSGLNYNVRYDLNLNDSPHVEAMFVEIFLKDRKNLVVGCVYRHPSSDISIPDFTEKYLEPILYKVNKEKKECVLMGDFNINLLNSTGGENAVSKYYNNLSSYFFTPYILQPSRLSSKTLVDHIFFNSLEYHSYSGNLLYELSDHLTQFLVLEGFVKERSLPETLMFKKDFKQFNEREFEETVINGLDWEEICMIRIGSPSASFKSFHDTLNFHIDEMVPSKKITLKQFRLMQKPWITKDILSRCDERDSLLNELKSEDDPIRKKILRTNFNSLRNQITKEKRQSKKAYFAAEFEKNKNTVAAVWKSIRSLVNLKPGKKSSIKLMDEQQNIISDSTTIANIFNEHFSTLGAKVQEKIPRQEGSYNSYLNKRSPDGKPIINPDGHTFFLSPTKPDEISKIIDCLNLKKSTGPNGIPVFILKAFKDFCSFWLSKLINLCFENGEFPELLKLAKVIPLHKKESILNYLNYRPISLLSVFSKIYEKTIYSRVYSYLVKNNLIYDKQFGFRGNHSVNHAIISITEHIRSLIDKGEYVCGVFVDLEKAFDTVHHDILCDKIRTYGLRGNINKLLKSYLTNRKQYVSINGHDSEVRDVTCGVPQGSSLGPLLFLIYINDLRLCLSKTSCGHFADDTFIIFHSKKPKTIETIINTELKEIVKWLRLNKLSLNATKTELIFFHSPKHPLNYDNISIKMNGFKLTPVDYLKYLGMYLDKYLDWNHHIEDLSKKLSRANGILSKLRYNAPLDICLQVYYAIFYSYLNIGCNVWSFTSEKNIDDIQKLQNKCIRIMTFAPFRSNTDQSFIDLGLLKVREVIKTNQLKVVYDYYDQKLPTDLMSMFILSQDVHITNQVLNSALNKLIHIPAFDTVTYGRNSIRYHCAKLWNDMFPTGFIQVDADRKKDVHLSKINSIHYFKKILKKHFLYKYSADDEDFIYY